MADGFAGAEVVDAIAPKEICLLNGKIRVNALTANASETVTISNVAPAAVGTATISAWLEIDVGGTAYYIPCWT